MLSGCAQSVKEEQFAAQERTLPEFPAWAKPVHVADPKTREDELTTTARERAGRGQANKIILSTRSWYGGVVRDYANPAAAR